jgi:hypothetical protein
VLFKEFYFDTLKSHFGTLKRLMEGKRFSADVKCEDPVTVQFDGTNIFVSNKHPYGDKFFRKEFILFVLTELRQTMWRMFEYLSQK